MSWNSVPLKSLLTTNVGGVWGAAPGGNEVDVHVARVTELRKGGALDLSTAARRSITQRQFASRQLQPGDLLVEKSGGGPRTPVGRVGLVQAVNQPTVCANFMQLMRPDSQRVSPRWLHLFLNHFHDADGTSSLQKATTNIRNLKMKEYVETLVPLPSLDEQRRIVGLVEEHLSHLDAADWALESASRRGRTLKRHRLWTLTHTWQDSTTRRLDEIAEVRLGRQRSPRNHAGERMRPYLRAGNVDWDEFRLDDVKSMQFTAAEEAVYSIRAGDILLVEASGSPGEVGKSALCTPEQEGHCFQNTLLRVRCFDAEPAFVQKYLLAAALMGVFLPESRGVGINHLGRGRLANLEINLPPSGAQAQAAAACADAVRESALLEKQLLSARGRAEALRRAILAAAFSGRLTGHSSDDDVIEETAANLATQETLL